MTSMKHQSNKTPGLLEIFITFFRIGFFTFGGGLAMVAVIRHEITSKKWLTEEDFIDSLALATAFPGAIAVNISLLVGNKIKGTLGAVVAMLGVVLPSFATILLIAFFLMRYFKNPGVVLFFKGAGASVAGLIAYSAFEMGKTILKSRGHILLVLLGIFSGLFLKVNPLLIILLSGIAGYFLCKEADDDIEDR